MFAAKRKIQKNVLTLPVRQDFEAENIEAVREDARPRRPAELFVQTLLTIKFVRDLPHLREEISQVLGAVTLKQRVERTAKRIQKVVGLLAEGRIITQRKCAGKPQIANGKTTLVNVDFMVPQVIPAKEQENMRSFAEKTPKNVHQGKRVHLIMHNRERILKNIAEKTLIDVDMMVRNLHPEHMSSRHMDRVLILRQSV